MAALSSHPERQIRSSPVIHRRLLPAARLLRLASPLAAAALSALLLSATAAEDAFTTASGPSRPDLSLGTQDPVARLQEAVEHGAIQLRFEPGTGYLKSLLEALRIPAASQLLVFSKTSGQRELISPTNPRAVYFNDQAYVAFVPGSKLLEISGVDPAKGAVFYTLDQEQADGPHLVQRNQCLECHTSAQTLNQPGYLVRSYATDGNGVVDIGNGFSMVDDRTPWPERWSGWYLCGIAHAGSSDQRTPGRSPGLELTTLGSRPLHRLTDTGKYPQPTSDIVALMVLQHQATLQNLILQLQATSRRAQLTTQASSELEAAEEALLKYMLFVEAARWERPIQGTPEFVSAFVAQGPRDKLGRSLRQFDLQTRLFKFPCSYMIYSPAFDALPRAVKLHVYHRLHRILIGQDPDPAFARIPAAEKRSVLEILTETKADVPIDWTL